MVPGVAAAHTPGKVGVPGNSVTAWFPLLEPSSPERRLHRIRHVFGPYSSQMGNSKKAEIVLEENIGIQADGTLRAAQLVTFSLTWKHQIFFPEGHLSLFCNLNTLEAQVSMAQSQSQINK